MNEYSWPPDYAADSKRAEEAWLATCISLPIGSLVTGTVIGRQPFGVFLKIDGVPDAVGLAEITALPSGSDLPRLHAQVSGEVIWHAEHNHQVRIRLTLPPSSTP
ncbi:hypothetical protein [Microbispora siamensis]|uniref:RNA-binding protein n=1 Tax=Microbispora siamensis TaxID=564413 RepID=A0ABQ4GH53_9ACTN|nr:hypothetical protein [Microbispora siamensis]GIH60746.1 hypothetical protein Msi02_15630 [Microbispora siamensis]